MATYSATDLIGKTLFITGSVPVYATTWHEGENKSRLLNTLHSGDQFVVKDFINKVSAYSQYGSKNYADNYYLLDSGGVVAFKDLAGKYDTKALLQQGLQSDEQKKAAEEAKNKSAIDKAGDLLKKYAIWVVGLVAAVIILPAVIRKR